MANSSTRSGDNDSTAARRVTASDALEERLAAEETVLVDFYADWCGPCRMMAPTVEELAGESDAAVVKVNVEELPSVATEYNVTSIPAFVVFQRGEPVERLVGVQEKADLQSALAQVH